MQHEVVHTQYQNNYVSVEDIMVGNGSTQMDLTLQHLSS